MAFIVHTKKSLISLQYHVHTVEPSKFETCVDVSPSIALNIDSELTGPSQTEQGSYTLIIIVRGSHKLKSVLFAMSCRPQHYYNTEHQSS